MKKDANISICENYRYQLSRVWDETKPKIMFVMLNPSTADADNDDPTIRKCINYTQKWGYGGLYVCNLFAYRATKPKVLLKIKNPFGVENEQSIKKYATNAEIIVCAWGNKKIVKAILKDKKPLDLLSFVSDKLYYLELTKKDNFLKHPLYLKADLEPIKFKK
jgi:hypothetical protein